jgi:hypothetical protein
VRGADTVPGATVRAAPGDELSLDVAVEGGEAHQARLRVVRSGQLLRDERVSVPGRIAVPLVGGDDGRLTYYRFELRGRSGKLLTNPIFVR